MDTPVKEKIEKIEKKEAKTDYKVIGTRPIRHDGVDKVTGRAVYGADFKLPGLLYGKVLRSPHAHARIKSIDTSAAEALPGVKAVICGKDFPAADNKTAAAGEGAVNFSHLSRNLMAQDKVLYHGHVVAAVAAINIHIAEEALALIKVDYEVLPPLMEVREAMKDANIILPEIRTNELGTSKGDKPSNIAEHIQHKRGDVSKGFADAAFIVEREFVTGTVVPVFISSMNSKSSLSVNPAAVSDVFGPIGCARISTMRRGGGLELRTNTASFSALHSVPLSTRAFTVVVHAFNETGPV